MDHNMTSMGLKVCVYFKIFTSVFKCVTDRLLAYVQNVSALQSNCVFARLGVHMCWKCQRHIHPFFTNRPQVDEWLDPRFTMCVCVCIKFLLQACLKSCDTE